MIRKIILKGSIDHIRRLALHGTIDFLRIALGTLADAKTNIDELYAWQFDGPFLRDFAGRSPRGRHRRRRKAAPAAPVNARSRNRQMLTGATHTDNRTQFLDCGDQEFSSFGTAPTDGGPTAS